MQLKLAVVYPVEGLLRVSISLRRTAAQTYQFLDQWQMLASILLCAAWGVPQSFAPALVRGARPTNVQNMFQKWESAATEFVEKKPLHMSFEGTEDSPLQLEVDEGAFGLEDPGEGVPGTQVVFNEYVGAVARGQPESLVLDKRDASELVLPNTLLRNGKSSRRGLRRPNEKLT